MRARVWCGAITKAQADQLEIDIDSPGDLFAAAIRRGSDLQIQNALAPTIAVRLPQYFTKACPQTTSFIILPSFQSTRQSPAFWSAATCRNPNPSVRRTCVCSERYAARLFWR